MNILTDVLSLIRRGVYAEKADLNDVLVLGKFNEQPDMTGVASPIPYKSVKVIKVRDFKVAAEHCDHANSPANPASGTGQVYQKTDVDATTEKCTVYFRSLKSMSSNLTLATSADDDYVEITTEGEPNLAANVGSGKKVYKDKVGETLNFRTLVEGSGITIGESANELTISSTGSGAVTSLTTTGTSGAATLVGGVLNIPVYSSGASSGTVTSVDASTAGDALDVTGGPITTNGTLSFTWAGSDTQYVNGLGNLVTFPAAGMTTFLVNGDSGSPQNVYDGNTLDIEGGTGIETVGTGGPKVVVNLTDTAVTPGTYTNATVVVDQQGRVTSITEAYKSYTCLLTQTGTSVPTSVILNNDAGISLTWSRTNPGSYRATYGSPVDLAKTAIFMSPNYKFSEIIGVLKTQSTTTFDIFLEGDNTGGQDDCLLNTPLEIRIYP